jgi:hypothetical protein
LQLRISHLTATKDLQCRARPISWTPQSAAHFENDLVRITATMMWPSGIPAHCAGAATLEAERGKFDGGDARFTRGRAES